MEEGEDLGLEEKGWGLGGREEKLGQWVVKLGIVRSEGRGF